MVAGVVGVVDIAEPGVSGCVEDDTAPEPAVLVVPGVVVIGVVLLALPALPLTAADWVGCAGCVGEVGEVVATFGCAADCGVDPACVVGAVAVGTPDATAPPLTSPHAASKPRAKIENNGRGVMAALLLSDENGSASSDMPGTGFVHHG